MREPEKTVAFSGIKLVLALLAGAGAGAAAGAAVMYLNAPRSGAQSRIRLQALAGDARNRVTRAPHALREASLAAERAFTKTLAEQLDSA